MKLILPVHVADPIAEVCADFLIMKSILGFQTILIYMQNESKKFILRKFITILFLESFVYSWQEFSAIPSEITGASLKTNLQLM